MNLLILKNFETRVGQPPPAVRPRLSGPGRKTSGLKAAGAPARPSKLFMINGWPEGSGATAAKNLIRLFLSLEPLVQRRQTAPQGQDLGQGQGIGAVA